MERRNPFDDEPGAAPSTPVPIDCGGGGGRDEPAPAQCLSPDAAGRLGLSKEEELILAIETAREMILQCDDEAPDKRKTLVAKLVQLRLQLQEIKEGAPEITATLRNICGHRFAEQTRAAGSNAYCDRCMGIVWKLIQPWLKCLSCGYRVHARCLPAVIRTCAALCAADARQFAQEICPRNGLSDQDFRCKECNTVVALTPGDSRHTASEARLCDYTGYYYCVQCHWNDKCVIPARVVANWHFEPQPVSRSSKQLLELLYRRPIVRLEAHNPALFNLIEELRFVKKLRSDILIMKCYFMCCRKAREQRILWKLKRHQHFVENSDMYSLMDLIELQSGCLEAELRAIASIFTQHIKHECETCQGNGFVCELCADKRVIYPFDDISRACKQCFAVFHRQCIERVSLQCPRCERRNSRKLAMVQMGDKSSSEESTETSVHNDT